MNIKRMVFDFWVIYPHSTALNICNKLALSYKKHGKYVNNLLYQFRYNLNLAYPKKPISHKNVFVWEFIERPSVISSISKWVISKNKNKMWVFRDSRGSIHWYMNGYVRLMVKGSFSRKASLARAKELFCRGFYWIKGNELKKYVDVPIREESRHWVFEIGSVMPRFDIRKFERSHGMRIYVDGSNPLDLEIDENRPFWLDSLEDVTDKLSLEIERHLKLIDKALELINMRILEEKKPKKKLVYEV